MTKDERSLARKEKRTLRAIHATLPRYKNLQKFYDEAKELIDFELVNKRDNWVRYRLKGTHYRLSVLSADDKIRLFCEKAKTWVPLGDVFESLPDELKSKLVYHIDLFA
jgi:hypothetical protein